MPGGGIEAVVDRWPVSSPDRPVGWLLVELNGIELDGARRVILETPFAEVGCGDGSHVIAFDQLEPGSTLTFERGNAETGAVLQGEETAGWPTLVPISAVRVRVPCPASTSARAEQLASQRDTWTAAGIDSYDFTIRYTTMFLNGTYRISVRGGVPVSAERLEPGGISDYLSVPELSKTIDTVFDQLEQDVAAPSFDVDFDRGLGYPMHAFVDRTENAIDDELEFFISDFVERPDEDCGSGKCAIG